LSNPVLDRPNAYILAEDGIPSKTEGRGDFLKDATKMALDYFNQKKSPFFLMVEGSYIDWGGHAEDADMMVAEVLDFDKTLGTVLDYVKEHPNTLLVVTADHETGGVSIGKYYEVDEAGNKKELNDKVAVYFNSNQHSGELIPVFAEGKGAENFQGIYENNEIYHKLFKALNQNKK
ncbi:MAG: alkaline phosphatase, partial [Bacteroidota bacterium]|nr:alkaline phosphatase [Bacteroidota bacterium]